MILVCIYTCVRVTFNILFVSSDMNDVEKKVRTIVHDGLLWGAGECSMLLCSTCNYSYGFSIEGLGAGFHTPSVSIHARL